MSMQFIIRFAIILALVALVSAGLIHYALDPKFTIIYWIFFVPVILGVPILSAVLLTKDEELDIYSVN